MMKDWRHALREARRDAGLSMEAVAGITGLSYETVRSYENGRRSPTRESLVRVLSAMELSAADANGILDAAGFAPNPVLRGSAARTGLAFRVDELQRIVDKRPWPAIGTDDAMRVVAANRAMQAVWNFDFARDRRVRAPREMTMFAIGGRCSFLDRITNWPISFRAAAEMSKARAERLRLPPGMPEMMEAMREISGGDAALLKKLVRVWTAAKPAPTRIQSDFPVVWADPEHGEMRFRSIISVVSERDLLSLRDWHPVDAESWQVLEQVKTSWLRRRKKPTSA